MRLLNTIAVTSSLLGSVAGIVVFPFQFEFYPVQSIVAVVAPLSLVTTPWVIHRTGQARLMAMVLLPCLYIMITLQAVSMGGLANPVSFYLHSVPVLAIFLLGSRAGLVYGSLCVLTFISMYFGRDFLPAPHFKLDMMTVGGNTATMVLMTISVTLFAFVFQREMERANIRLDSERTRADLASRTKSQIIATVSHDVRTPMNGILNMADALHAANLPQDQHQQVTVIRQSGSMLMHLFSSLLDLSKIESGKLAPARERFSLNVLLEGLGSVHATTAASKNIGFHTEITETASGTYTGDPSRVMQIVNNLVGNAIKFTEVGEVHVHVDGKPSKAPGFTTLTFVVSDSGIGISPSVLDQLFEPFSQAHVGIARNYGGTGLGLSICKRLCELMDGGIEVTSNVGQGSIFTAWIDVAHAQEPLTSEREIQLDPEAFLRAQREPIRLLVADDSRVNQLVVANILRDIPIALTNASDGKQAIEAWLKQAHDVILMDTHMPVMNGVDATESIRALAADQSRSPVIIAFTGDTNEQQLIAYQRAGIDAVLQKPLVRADLLQTLASLLQARPQQGSGSERQPVL